MSVVEASAVCKRFMSLLHDGIWEVAGRNRIRYDVRVNIITPTHDPSTQPKEVNSMPQTLAQQLADEIFLSEGGVDDLPDLNDAELTEIIQRIFRLWTPLVLEAAHDLQKEDS